VVRRHLTCLFTCGSAALSCGKASPFRGAASHLVGGLRLRLKRRGAASPKDRGEVAKCRKGRAFPQDKTAEPQIELNEAWKFHAGLKSLCENPVSRL